MEASDAENYRKMLEADCAALGIDVGQFDCLNREGLGGPPASAKSSTGGDTMTIGKKRAKRRYLTDGEKAELIMRHKSGTSFAALAAEYGMPPSSLSRICRRLLTGGDGKTAGKAPGKQYTPEEATPRAGTPAREGAGASGTPPSPPPPSAAMLPAPSPAVRELGDTIGRIAANAGHMADCLAQMAEMIEEHGLDAVLDAADYLAEEAASLGVR